MVFRPAHLLWLGLALSCRAEACGVVSGAAQVRAAEGGEVALVDGRRVRLGGVRLTPEGEVAARGWAGKRVGVAALGSASDRWGRLVVDLVGESGESLALDLLLRGLAFVRPEVETGGCDAERLEAEAAARAAGEGVWGANGAVLAADDAKGLAAADARFVLVSGVVRRVGAARTKVYLDFGGQDGFSVTVARKAEDRFRRAGIDLHALAGRKVLVRGVLDNRFGPRIEIADPAMIEILESATGRGG